MAGRHRRKDSNSTVATVDTSRRRWLKETDILKPMHESLYSDTVKWPCFVLTDATVYLKDGKTPANPLLPDYPFVVRGKLEVDVVEDKQRDALRDPDITAGYIEIRGATMYSISWGPLAIWVSGLCGWFELASPSAQFAEIYNEMREAVTLYYGILDVFEDLKHDLEQYNAAPKNERKRMRRPTVALNDVLFKYAVAVGDGMFRDEAEDLCHKWASFLINHFPREEDFLWNGTFFYTWIIDKHPDVYKEHQKRVAEEVKRLKATGSKALPPVQRLPPVQSLEASSRAFSVRSQSRSASLRRQSVDTDVDMKDISPAPSPPQARQSSVKIRKTPPGPAQPPPGKLIQATAKLAQNVSVLERPQSTPTEIGTSPVDVLVEALEWVAANHKSFPAKTTEKTISSRIYPRYSISNYASVLEIVAYYSKTLVRRLDPKWHATEFWGWLVNESQKPKIELRTVTEGNIPRQLVRRMKKTEPATPAAPADTLPPKLGIRSKARSASEDEGLHSDDDDDFSGHRRHAGKGGLRLQSASKKRTVTDVLEDEPTGGRRGRKAAKTFHYFDIPNYVPDMDEEPAASDSEGDHATSSQDEDVDEDDDEDDDDNHDADGLLVSPPKDAVRVVVHAEKLPSMSPSGPNGTWVCDQDGCGFVVRAAEEAAGRALVQRHFRDHEARTQKVALARTEAERRGRMPINHLLEKIQKMGKDNLLKGREVIKGEEVPLPIKRRLIV